MDDIQETLINQISGLNWMSEETKQEAILKARNILTKMGHSERLNNVTTMDESLAQFHVVQNETIFQSWMRWAEFEFIQGVNGVKERDLDYHLSNVKPNLHKCVASVDCGRLTDRKTD